MYRLHVHLWRRSRWDSGMRRKIKQLYTLSKECICKSFQSRHWGVSVLPRRYPDYVGQSKKHVNVKSTKYPSSLEKGVNPTQLKKKVSLRAPSRAVGRGREHSLYPQVLSSLPFSLPVSLHPTIICNGVTVARRLEKRFAVDTPYQACNLLPRSVFTKTIALPNVERRVHRV